MTDTEQRPRIQFRRDRTDVHDLSRQRYTCTVNGIDWDIDHRGVWMASPSDPSVWIFGTSRRDLEVKMADWTGATA